VGLDLALSLLDRLLRVRIIDDPYSLYLLQWACRLCVLLYNARGKGCDEKWKRAGTLLNMNESNPGNKQQLNGVCQVK
jgi:hypothetical protein